MGLLSQHILLYDKLGLALTPVGHNKGPFIDEWQHGHDVDMLIEKYPNHDFALITGKISNIVALDLDTKDKDAQKDLLELLKDYASPISRKGSKLKLPSFFFKYNENTKESSIKIYQNKKKETFAELLSDGRCCVLPPSRHPEGHKFEWGDKATLLNFNLDYLPDWPDDLWEKIQSIASKYDEGYSYDSKCSSGRNDTLKDHIFAKQSDGKDISQSIQEIIEYDQEKHDPPLFTDKSERAGRFEPWANATIFYSNILKSRLERGETIPNPFKGPVIQINEVKPIAKEKLRAKFPKMRGYNQDMFEYIYESSPVKRSRFAFASVLATMGTLLGNKVRLHGIYSNIYLLIVANSGDGKNFPIKFPKKLFNKCDLKHLIGISDVASDNSILMNLNDEKNVRLDTIDEAAKLFGATNNKEHFLSRIGDIYAELYTSAGEYFGGKTAMKYGTIGECLSPCISLLGAMTYRDANNHMSFNMIEKGLGARFLYFPETKAKDVIKINKTSEIPFKVTQMAKKIGLFENKSFNVGAGHNVFDLKVTKKADLLLDDYLAHVNLKRKEHRNDIMGPFVNRMYENALKLAMIDHAGVSEAITSDVNKSSIEWSISVMETIYLLTKNLFTECVSENDAERDLNKTLKAITNCELFITRSDLMRQTRLNKSRLNQAIDSLSEMEKIEVFQYEGKTCYKPYSEKK